VVVEVQNRDWARGDFRDGTNEVNNYAPLYKRGTSMRSSIASSKVYSTRVETGKTLKIIKDHVV